MYYVYIVKCSDGSLYTGYTKNVEQRIQKHNGEIKGGAKYTRGRAPVTLVYTEQYESKSEAMKREVIIKQLSRRDKAELIKSV